jgi:filamentous hemagglutinin family protein
LTKGQAGAPRVRGGALASVSILSLVVMSVTASAQPTGGSVVAGQAQISSAGANTLINQTSSKAIINWQSFSVGQGGSVQFNQPNSGAITLNRVTGAGASTIDGAIRANGQVWLLNPNGLLFGSGAAINVGGLLATTSDLADQDFLTGRYNFSSTGGKGSITNSGTIKTGNGGAVVLSAPSVTNKGLIAATAGHVILGGTETFTVDFNGDHLLSYAVSPNSSGGKVSNSGKIAAAGGTILMTARAAAGVQDAVINNTGMVEATSVRQENGEIILEADNGTVSNSGTLDASGKGTGQTGGTVKVLGQQVAVSDGARIDVSGDAGGGTALIGGNLHGAGPESNAQNTSMGKATINASAITSGKGGTVAVYSTGNTSVAAVIMAQGGVKSGNGGTVETSGHELAIATSASVSTAAPRGAAGDWLLDPDTITISTSGISPDTGQTFSTSGSATISPTTIDASLNAGSNVLLQANQDITVSNAVLAVSGNTLEMDAGRSIILNAGLQVSGGSIVLSAGNPGATGGSQSGAAITQATGASIVAGSLSVLNQTAAGTITLMDAGNSFGTLSVTTNGGDTSVTTSGSVGIAGANLASGNFTLSATGSVTQTAAITANNLTVGTSGANITLSNTGNNVTGAVTLHGTDITFVNSFDTQLSDISLDGTNAANSASITESSSYYSIYQSTGPGIIAASISLITDSGCIACEGTPLFLNGGSSGTSPQSTSLSISTNGGGVRLVSYSPLAITGSGLDLNNSVAGYAGGSLFLESNGGVTVNAPIATSGNFIAVDSGATIQVNAPITAAAGGGSGPASLVLTANDPNLNLNTSRIAFNSDTAGITGSGLLTSSYINLTAGSGQHGQSGGIGTATQPLQVASDTGSSLSLAIQTHDGNAYINSTSGISVDDHINLLVSSGVTFGGDGGAIGVNTAGSNGLYGAVSITAAGPISQTFGIQSGDLTLTSTASDITMVDGGCSTCSPVDPGNVVFGTLHLNSSGAATYYSGASTTAVNLGSSTIAGGLTLQGGSQNDINIADPSGGAVHAASVYLVASGGNISISSPLLSDTSLTLSANGGIRQITSGTTDAHIAAGTTFLAQALGSSISLSDLGHGCASGGSCAADAGNQIVGNVVLESGGGVNFANVPGITLGIMTPSGQIQALADFAGGGVFELATPGDITIATGVNITAGDGLGAGATDFILQAGRRFINNSGLGQATLVSSNNGIFNIYSAAPGGDTFGNLDSGNTAVWNTNYLAPVTATGSRYVFAFQPTLTINSSSISKVYGTDATSVVARLGYTVSGLQSGEAGAYLGDTASNVYGGGIQLISTGAASSAAVGAYMITASSVGDGYAVSGQGTVTVNPATLNYVANAANRIYGSANPAFSGTVTGLVNGDTLASATTGTLGFSSSATASSPVGSYAIAGSGLSATNYVFAQAASNASALTISPATLTYVANAASRPYDSVNPVFSGTVSGFVNGDTQASATSGTLIFTSSATETSPAGSYAIDGSGLTASNYVFAQAPSNASALTITPALDTSATTVLTSFITSIQAPVLTPLSSSLAINQIANLITLPVVPPPPPPPPPSPLPPVQSLLSDQSDTPNSSDQTTNEVASSLDGGSTSSGNSGSGGTGGDTVVIPNMLVNGHPPPPPPTDISALSSFGNSSLWQ